MSQDDLFFLEIGSDVVREFDLLAITVKVSQIEAGIWQPSLVSAVPDRIGALVHGSRVVDLGLRINENLDQRQVARRRGFRLATTS